MELSLKASGVVMGSNKAVKIDKTWRMKVDGVTQRLVGGVNSGHVRRINKRRTKVGKR